MTKRFAVVAAVCAILALSSAPVCWADPGPPPTPPAGGDPAPPPPDGAVPSEAPSSVDTPDGWHLTVAASNETQVAVNPLTTALSSREYVVGASFSGSVTGSGTSNLAGGTLEVGYQIGCGITADKIKLSTSIGLGTSGHTLAGLLPTGMSVPIAGSIAVALRPGEVILIPVDKKAFKGTRAQVTMKDVHVKLDGCVGQSFLRSYAVLTSAASGGAETTNDIVAYYGVTKTV